MTRHLILLLCSTLAAPIVHSETSETLADQLRELAARHHFTLDGDANAEEAKPSTAQGEELPQRLRAMLRDFNFVLVQPPGGEVERLIVIGRKGELPAAPPPNDEGTALETERAGSHHIVSATLIGANGAELPLRLMVDTGATAVVLPRSLAGQLGIAEDALAPRVMQTANGKVEAGIAQIAGMRLGEEEIHDVEVAFIDDAQLGEMALLGMSVLSRFKVVLDDQANTLTLESRD